MDEEGLGDGIGRMVLAALERLETRLSRLEERVETISLTGQAEPTGPSTSIDSMLEDVLVKLYQIENRVDSIERRQEKEREEREKRRSDKRRAATALLRQQGLAIGPQRASAAIAPLRAVPPRPPAKKPPSLPTPLTGTHEAVPQDDGANPQHQTQQDPTWDAEEHADAGHVDQQQSVGQLLEVRKPLPAFPSPNSRRRMKSMTTYVPHHKSSELLLQLAEMELQEQANQT